MEATFLERWTPPDWFVGVNKSIFGDRAAEFAERLPAAVESLSAHWKIRVDAPYTNMLQNFVAPATFDNGAEAVIKISADLQMIQRQADTLVRFNGSGVVRLLEVDLARGALLIERASPGLPLNSDFNDGTTILIETQRQIWRAKNQTRTTAIPSLAYLADWMREEITGTRRALIAADLSAQMTLVDEAEILLEDLLSSSKEELLLHGDLHSNHVLSAGQRGWLAIDPLGLFGERAFDVSTLFRDDSATLKTSGDPSGLLSQRARRLIRELDVDWDRVRGWGLVQAAYARNWRFKVGLPSPDWSVGTKFLAAGIVRLSHGVCWPLMVVGQLSAVVVA